jgi:hypothetical protein
LFYKEYRYQIDRLLQEPELGKPLKGDLQGYQSIDFRFDNVSLRICYKIIVTTQGLTLGSSWTVGQLDSWTVGQLVRKRVKNKEQLIKYLFLASCI